MKGFALSVLNLVIWIILAFLFVLPVVRADVSGGGLTDFNGNGITSQASGSQRALDIGINVSGSQVDPRARTWSLSNGTDFISAVQSGAWTTGRTWTLLNSTDSVNAVQSGTWTVQQGTPPWSVSQSGTWTVGRSWTLASGTDSVTSIQGTSPWVTNISQFGGTNLSTGTGASGLGIPRVTVSNDSKVIAWDGTNTTTVKPASTSPLATDTALVMVQSPNGNQSTAANQTTINSSINSFATQSHTDTTATEPRNLAQVNGTTVNVGIGASSTGTQRVAVANDSTIKIWDGSNTMAVAPASTATTSTEPAAVVGLSPNSNQVQGTVASGSTDSTNPVKVGGIYHAATQNFSDDQRADLQMNVHGSILTDATSTDVSGTFTATGNTSAIDSAGNGSIAFTVDVSAASGTTPTLDVHLEESDDGINDWIEQYDADRFTTTGTYKAARQSLHARFYRFKYVIGGTSPSFTFTIRTTLKPMSGPIIRVLNKFNDLVMTSANNFSSTIDLEGCSFFSATLTRGAGGAGVTLAPQFSNDGVDWVNGTTTINSSASTTYLSANNPGATTKYARFTNTNSQASATTLDIKYYCKE